MFQQRVKIFTAFSVEAVERLEDEINKWLAEDELREIVNTKSHYAQDPGSEEYGPTASLVVMIWYRGGTTN